MWVLVQGAGVRVRNSDFNFQPLEAGSRMGRWVWVGGFGRIGWGGLGRVGRMGSVGRGDLRPGAVGQGGWVGCGGLVPETRALQGRGSKERWQGA